MWEASSGPPSARPELVAEERQLPIGGDRRIDLAQRPGRGVAGVDVELRLLAGRLGQLDLALVEPLEGRQLHVDLAPGLEHRREVARQALGDVGDGADIVGDVLPHPPVAAGRTLHEHAVLVAQRDRQPVELQLDGEPGHGLILEPPHDPLVPARSSSRSKALCSDIIGTVWVTGANASLVPPPTRWVMESGVTSSGWLGLERDELVVEPIPLRVGDLGRVELVVLAGVVIERGPQFGDASRRSAAELRV